MSEKRITKKKFMQVPHTYVILFTIILIVAALTYIVPAGEYDRIEDPNTNRTVVDPASFHNVEQSPVSFFQLWQSVPKGMKDAAGIIFFVFIVGGSFQIVNGTGAVEAMVARLALKLRNYDKLIIPIFLIIFSIFGGTIGMAEETLAFIPIGVILARALGYDAIVGVAMIALGAACGFSSGFMNPFTVGIAQGIAELPMFSGIGLRIAVLVVMLLVTMLYIFRYAKKVKDNPEYSFVRELEAEEAHKALDLDNLPVFKTEHYFVLFVLFVGLALVVFGVFQYGWYITEIASTMLAIGVLGGLAGKMGPSAISKEFVKGAKGIVMGALVIGIARGILIVMQEGYILDSIIYGFSGVIQALPKTISVLGMYIVQIVINFFIPSGSGQAATTMPIMIPLSDVVSINRQIAVMAYHFGDGFTNQIIPTSGVLMSVLSIAKVPYEKWFKFIWPLMLIWIGVGATFLVIAQVFNYGPF